MRVLAFARVRELLGSGELERVVPSGATVRQLWDGLARDFPALADLDRSTSLRRGARALAFDDVLGDGDEIALLPPYGGG